jgi:hypothetical protein
MHSLEKLLYGATNIYRTKNYIVKQCMGIEYHNELENTLCSQDTYYKRTKARDKEYEKIFADKQNVNGKRIHSSMYSRTYID